MTARLWRPTFVLLEVVLVVAMVALAIAGFDAVFDTTEGRAVDPELDPLDPGYEAFLEPTPVALALGLDAEGQLAWATLLVLGGAEGAGGAVVFVPVATVLPADTERGWIEETVQARFAAEGADVTRHSLAEAFAVGIDEVDAIDPGRMAALLAPVTPLPVTNPDQVADFGSGELSLPADAVVEYLLAASEEESDLTRLVRHEGVWRPWLAAIAASTDPDVVPGEGSSGVGRFLRGIAAGTATFDVPVVTEVSPEDLPAGDGSGAGLGNTYVLDGPATTDLLEERIPFPAAARPGGRLRVRVLDGVGADGLTLAVGRDVVRASGQVVLIGNGDRFDATTTRVFYFDGALTDRVTAMAEALGFAAEQLDGPNPDDGVDVTVLVGADLLAAYGLVPRASTNGADPG